MNSVIFANVFSAASSNGLGTVYVRGRPPIPSGSACSPLCGGSRYYLETGLTVPQGMKLQCATAPAGQSETSGGNSQGDYSSIPFTLVVHENRTTPTYYTIKIGQASQIQGCEIQQDGLDTTPSGSAVTYRNLMNGFNLSGGVASMAGTAITFGSGGSPNGAGDNAEVRDTTIIGFNTGIYSSKNSDIKISNVMDDSTLCADIQNQNYGVATIRDLYCYPLLTRQTGPDQQKFFMSSIVANTSGGYRAYLCTLSACGGVSGAACFANNNCPQTNDVGWISNPQGAESTGGRWTLSCDGNSTAPATYCDLLGSNSSTTNVTATPTFATGATQITSVPTNFAMLTTASGTSYGSAYGPGSNDYLIRLAIDTSTISGLIPLQSGEIVSVTGFTGKDTPEANGVWQIQKVDTATPPNWIELHNSIMINPCGGGGHQPNCPAHMKIEWGYPSVGQTVSGTNIYTPTTVTGVWPAQDMVFLSHATTGASSGTITYKDNPFGYSSNPINSIYQCMSPNSYDICLTVNSTYDLVSGSSDIVVTGAGTTGANKMWAGVILGDNGTNPGTTIDLPCPTAPMTNCLVTSCSGTCGNFMTGYLILNASERLGDAVYLAAAGTVTSDGIQIENFQTFEHECGLHFATGSEADKAVNVKIDQYDSINDILFCGVRFDGTADGNVVTNGEINAAGTDILADITPFSLPQAGNTVENLKLGVSQGTLAFRSIFEDEGASSNLALAHNIAHPAGYGLVADNIRSLVLTSNVMPNVDVYFQSTGSAQANTTGMLNQFDSNTPNMATMGSCSSTASLATPMSLCGFMGVPTQGYIAGTNLLPIVVYKMFANVGGTTVLHYVSLGDAADGSGKCHWIIASTPLGTSLNVLPLAGSSDQINGLAGGVTIPSGKTGMYCSSNVGKWWGGYLN